MRRDKPAILSRWNSCPPQGPATHGETSLGRIFARRSAKRRQRDDRAAARKGEGIEPRNPLDRGPTVCESWKAIVGIRQGEDAGDLGGV